MCDKEKKVYVFHFLLNYFRLLLNYKFNIVHFFKKINSIFQLPMKIT